MGVAGAAYAQDDAAASDEKIVVTGSRIKTDATSRNPITTVDSEQIALTSTTTLEDLLVNLPSVTYFGINEQTNNGGSGLSWIEMRDLGVTRTLVLVNGRRFTPTTNGLQLAVDFNNIPVAMIDRIEVLRDGASAVYGSDAIAGVINVILKTDYEGLTTSAFVGQTEHDDGAIWQANASAGANLDNDKGNVTLGIDFSQADPIQQTRRGWDATPRQAYQSNPFVARYETIGSLVVPTGINLATFDTYAFDAGNNVVACFVLSALCNDGVTPTPYYYYENYVAGVSNVWERFNYGPFQYLTSGNQRQNVFGTFRHELWGSNEFFAEVGYTGRQSKQRLAPEVIGPGTANFLDGFIIPEDHPTVIALYGAGAGGQPLYRRMLETGPRIFKQDGDAFRAVAGIKGEWLDGWDYEFSYNIGRSKVTDRTENVNNFAKLLTAVNPTACAADASCSAVLASEGALLDPFGLGSITEGWADFIRAGTTDQSKYTQQIFSLSTTGDLFDLPAGAVGFAAGAEWREETGSFTPDLLTSSGDSSSNKTDPTNGGYEVAEVYAEALIPLLSGMDFVKMLELSAAVRYSDYSTFGDTTNYKFGLDWAVDDNLRVRSSIGTGFRAPNITELFGGAVDSFIDTSDPCSGYPTGDATIDANCAAGGGPFALPSVPGGYTQPLSQIRNVVGGNPEAGPEESDQWTVGVVITPTFIERLTVNVDYYNVEVDKFLANPNGTTILENCYTSVGLSHPDCERITRNPVTGEIAGINASIQNFADQKTSGVDFGVLWGFGLDDMGDLEFNLQGNYQIEFLQRTLTTDPYTDFTGIVFNSDAGGIQPHWRGVLDTTYRIENWTINYSLRYLGGADYAGFDCSVPDPDSFCLFEKVEPWTTHDISVRYDFDGANVTVGADNFIDSDPPFVPDSGTGGTNTSVYDVRGAFYWVRVGADW